ncbi:MAG: TOBE domain-containing protein [Candidatus Korobacteraceae bacterium]
MPWSEWIRRWKSRRASLAPVCRPSEIDLYKQDGVRGLIKRKTYLGDIIDYRVMVGTTEVRVQKSRRSALFAEGETCYLQFNWIHFYPHE